MLFGIFLILSVYIGANFYIARCLYLGIILNLPNPDVWIFSGIYVFFALSLLVRFLPVPYGIKRFIDKIGTHWIGIFVYSLLLFIIAEIVILLGRAIQIIPSPTPTGIRFWSALTVVFITTALMLYGKYNASKIRHATYNIQLKKPSLSGELKIAMIADLHLGYSIAEKRLPKIVQDINEIKPDIVCIAGDTFTDDIKLIRNSDRVIELFKSIKATYGVYACLGNHDAGRSFNGMLRFFDQCSIKLLQDEYKIIDDRFVLIGRIDASPIGGYDGLKRVGIAEITAEIDPGLPVIVMDHNPAHIIEYDNKIDLVLSGHTHKGQFFPVTLITKSIYISDYGHYQKDAESPHNIITSGVSTWGVPIRIGSNNEIVSITIR